MVMKLDRYCCTIWIGWLLTAVNEQDEDNGSPYINLDSTAIVRGLIIAFNVIPS